MRVVREAVKLENGISPEKWIYLHSTSAQWNQAWSLQNTDTILHPSRARASTPDVLTDKPAELNLQLPRW